MRWTRLIVAIIALAVLGLIGFKIYEYFSKSPVTISTGNKEAEVFILEQHVYDESTQKSIGKGEKVGARLKNGDYSFLIRTDNSETLAHLSIPKKDSYSLEVDLIEFQQPKLQASQTAYSPISSGKYIRYVNQPLRQIYELRKGDSIGYPVYLGEDIVNVWWFDSKNAILELSSGELAVLVNDEISGIGFSPERDVDGEYQSYGASYVKISGNWGLIAYSDRYYVIKKASSTARWTLEAESFHSATIDSKGNVYTYPSLDDLFIHERPDIDKFRLVRYSGKNYGISRSVDLSHVSDVIISPSGKTALVKNLDGLSLLDLNSSKSTFVSLVTSFEIKDAIWSGNYIYTRTKEGMWRIDTKNNRVDLLVRSAEPITHDRSFSLTPKSLLFGTTDPPEYFSNGSLYSIPLSE